MSNVHLQWPNKELSLRAMGSSGYKWVLPTDQSLKTRLKLRTTSMRPLDMSDNVLAIGDGLDTLEALGEQTSVFERGIRLVYIDPPFNTDADVRHYNDMMDRPMWLSMMRDRLVALRPLLAETASVWVHLDDAEVHRARLVMDEVFGDRAFVASVVWQKKASRDSRAAFSTNHDTILVYSPGGPKKWKSSRNRLPQDTGHLNNRDDDPRGPWSDAPFTAPGYRNAQQYEIVTPTGRVLKPPRGRSWYATEASYRELLADNRIWFPKNGSGSPRIKNFRSPLRGLVPFTVWSAADVGSNDDAKRHLMDLFPGKDVFDTPKPEKLLERIIHIATNPGDLVVDIFGGSGTTAAVSHKMGRRWLVVERNINTVLEFLLPRLQRVIQGTDSGGVTSMTSWVGGGCFEVAQILPRFGKIAGNVDFRVIERNFLRSREAARFLRAAE